MRKILLAEPDPQTQVILTVLLQEAGYRVISEPGGAKALGLIERERPQLLIVESKLDDMPGLELVTRVRAAAPPGSERLPIILLTREAGVAFKVEAFERGVDDYLEKPLFGRELVERVRQRMRRHSIERIGQGRPEGDRFEGVLTSGFLLDLTLELSRRRRTCLLVLNRDERSGVVRLRNGTVHSAALGEVRGEEAFLRLSLWHKGDFRVVFDDAGEEGQNIHRDILPLVRAGELRLRERDRLADRMLDDPLAPLTALLGIEPDRPVRGLEAEPAIAALIAGGTDMAGLAEKTGIHPDELLEILSGTARPPRPAAPESPVPIEAGPVATARLPQVRAGARPALRLVLWLAGGGMIAVAAFWLAGSGHDTQTAPVSADVLAPADSATPEPVAAPAAEPGPIQDPVPETGTDTIPSELPALPPEPSIVAPPPVQTAGVRPDHESGQTEIRRMIREGRLTEAGAAARRLGGPPATISRTLSAVAGAAVDRGQLQEAVGLYQAALALTPDGADIHLKLADVLVNLGQNRAARTHYEAFLGLRPDGPEAAEVRSIVDGLR